MQIGLRYDDTMHRKLKVIAAYEDKSLNKLIMSLFENKITNWEKAHGEIKFPEE